MTITKSSIRRLAVTTLSCCYFLGLSFAQAQDSMDDQQPAPLAVPQTNTAVESGSSNDNDQSGAIARATFTSNVVGREPVDSITSISKTSGEMYYFTELKDMEGQTVTHRWEYNGEVMAEVEFKVGAPRWRVYSVKKLDPKWTGKWTVVVTDGNGTTLKTDSIEVVD